MPVLAHVTHLSTTSHESLITVLQGGALPALKSLQLTDVRKEHLLPVDLVLKHTYSTDDTLVGLVAERIDLEELAIRRCSTLTNASLATLMCMPSLSVLKLLDCKHELLTCRGVKVLARHPALEQLEVHGCKGINIVRFGGLPWKKFGDGLLLTECQQSLPVVQGVAGVQ